MSVLSFYMQTELRIRKVRKQFHILLHQKECLGINEYGEKSMKTIDILKEIEDTTGKLCMLMV